MPNFWTKNMQKLDEKRKGPRTRDYDFYYKVEEMIVIEKAMRKLKYVCDNFIHNFEKIMEYNRELSECVFLLYNKNAQFKEFSDSMTKIHTESNKVFHNVGEEMNKISEITRHWGKYFENIQSLIDVREEARRNYDHYEKKLAKMEKLCEHRENKECLHRHLKFMEALERNERKFIIAKKDYIDKTTKAYSTIQSLLDRRFDIINPVLLKMFTVEEKIYESFYSQFTVYKYLKEKMSKNIQLRDQENFKYHNQYNPLKFMKNGELDKKFKFKSMRRSLSDHTLNGSYFNKKSQNEKTVINSSTIPDEFNKIQNVFSSNICKDNDVNQSNYTNRTEERISNSDVYSNVYNQKINLQQ